MIHLHFKLFQWKYLSHASNGLKLGSIGNHEDILGWEKKVEFLRVSVFVIFPFLQFYIFGKNWTSNFVFQNLKSSKKWLTSVGITLDVFFEIAIYPKFCIPLFCLKLISKDLNECYRLKLSIISYGYEISQSLTSKVGQKTIIKQLNLVNFRRFHFSKLT